MPLVSDPAGEFDLAEDEAVLFAMFDGEDRIVCRVEWAGLRDLTNAEGADPTDIAGTFEKHRARIERIASEHYAAGQQLPVVRSEQLTAG
jgi:Protein of unknown function (DUF1488)